jgi:acyl-coenzyme A thioesterase PaaI-like protein
MRNEKLRQAILQRAEKIPIVDTFQMELVSLAEGFCELRTPRELRYDGVFESIHGGLRMT